MHSNFNDLKNRTMTAKEFLEENGIPNMPTQFTKDEQTDVSNTAEALEAYHQAKLKLLGIADVTESVCDNCEPVSGFYLGTTCQKCNRPFRSVKQTVR